MLDTGLQGRVALITGANHGIGAATAQALAAQGARVYIHYLRVHEDDNNAQPDALPETAGPAQYAAYRRQDASSVVAAIRDAGGEVASGEGDLSDPATIPALFNAVEETLGPVEILVNNAADWEADSFIPPELDAANPLPALFQGHATEMFSVRTHDRHFAVNSRAVGLMMREFFTRYLARGASWGRIINLTTGGADCFPGEISYGASKAALESYSRSAAVEMARFGITVNIVSPSATQTGWITPELETAIVPMIPAGRLGQPDDIADAIVFLASEQARWVTGQLLHAAGGQQL